MKASKADIKFFHMMLDKLHKKMCEDNCGLAFDELKALAKHLGGIDPDESLTQISHTQMQDLKLATKQLAHDIKCKIENID